jgi:alginate O-acetyltransferase complex protein AlgI
MVFNSLEFFIFLVGFLLIFYGIAKTKPQKIWCITLGSLVFYGFWDYRFIPLLLFTAALDFYIALKIDKQTDKRIQLRYLWISVFSNLGVLAYFKYMNFFIGACYGLMQAFGLANGPAPVLNIILPIGISFYTFQSLSYVIDVYRGELKPRDKLEEMLAGVLFFPHLVAGPIIRATTLLPQFEKMALKLSDSTLRRGLLLILVGLLKKGVGDMLGLHADRFYSHVSDADLSQAWIGTLAFTGQIYCDFSGYTDIAIGTALLLGFQLPPNFNQPYLATSPSDFWKRWHMSLSSWLRDYLYIPLGGKYHQQTRNLFITMLLGGLWHGANWTFIIWGAYHGILLICTHQFTRSKWRLEVRFNRSFVRILGMFLTFYLIHVGWVLFRAPSIDIAFKILTQMHKPFSNANLSIDFGQATFVISAIVFSHLVNLVHKAITKSELSKTEILQWATIGILLALGIASNGSSTPFIYFQF